MTPFTEGSGAAALPTDDAVRITMSSRFTKAVHCGSLNQSDFARNLSETVAASVVDLFCGAGGLSFGFKREAFPVAAGIDIDEACRYPYEKNIGSPFVRKNVADMSSSDLGALFEPNTMRVLVGCAPCQPFSTYNQKNEHADWTLLGAFGELISLAQPDVISMENVPRLVTFRSGSVFKAFLETLRTTGYKVVWGVLYGPAFGLAQTRSRLVLLASRLGQIAMPLPTHTPDAYRTVQDEIGDMPPLEHGQVDAVDAFHCASRLSETNARRIAAAKPGGTWRDWTPELVSSCHKAKSGKGYSSVYGRMMWNAPSPTITTQFYGFGNGRFGHPEQDRALSLREGALLQSFPSDYKFAAPGDPIHFKKIGRMIGNAVPVVLAEAIARTVKQHIQDLA